ncbi:unnamed protein product [Staurois parvus]|uniref:Uncharacterized protein n=1 Tax=Staurois parvus TaxID=386267 RepID=A0ABN9EGV4_9NEOB|nr:unnamed protein product [Staurois parvus]
MGPLCPCPNSKKPMKGICSVGSPKIPGRTTPTSNQMQPVPKYAEGVAGYSDQGRTDISWGPRAIGDHGAPVS